jgi:hypothetical protein
MSINQVGIAVSLVAGGAGANPRSREPVFAWRKQRASTAN